MRPNRDMEALARMKRVASDFEDMLNAIDAARSLILTMPQPDVTKEPKLAAVYSRAWAAIQKFAERGGEKTEPSQVAP
jgi:hypothetical protein